MKEFFSIIRSSQLFSGVSEEELTAMLSCLETRKESFPKDALLLRIGDTADAIGLVLSGSILIIQEDIWGNRNIISKAGVGQTFAAASKRDGSSISSVCVSRPPPCDSSISSETRADRRWASDETTVMWSCIPWSA